MINFLLVKNIDYRNSHGDSRIQYGSIGTYHWLGAVQHCTCHCITLGYNKTVERPFRANIHSFFIGLHKEKTNKDLTPK